MLVAGPGVAGNRVIGNRVIDNTTADQLAGIAPELEQRFPLTGDVLPLFGG